MNTAIFTGAGPGIDAAKARRLASLSCNLALVGRRKDILDGVVAGFRNRVIVLADDLGDPAATKRIADQIYGRFGRIDSVINNVATIKILPLTDYQLDVLTLHWAVNICAPFLLIQVSLLALRERGGAVVNIFFSSGTLLRPGQSVYCMIRAVLDIRGGKVHTNSHRLWSFLTMYFRVFALPLLAACLGVSSAMADGRHANQQLEAKLPIVLRGVAITVESQAGKDLMTNSQIFDTFLGGLKKTRADFTVASGYTRNGLRASVGAWQVNGAETAKLLPGFEAALQASSNTNLTIAEEKLGARNVTRIGDPGQLAQGPLYVFVQDDALFFVQTPDPRLAEEAMTKLPQ